MKKIFELIAIAAVASCTAQPATNWAPAGDRIMTKWAAEVNPSNPLPEYPRPQLQRKDWKSLNGLWDYAIIGKDAEKPDTFDGEILVEDLSIGGCTMERHWGNIVREAEELGYHYFEEGT